MSQPRFAFVNELLFLILCWLIKDKQSSEDWSSLYCELSHAGIRVYQLLSQVRV